MRCPPDGIRIIEQKSFRKICIDDRVGKSFYTNHFKYTHSKTIYILESYYYNFLTLLFTRKKMIKIGYDLSLYEKDNLQSVIKERIKRILTVKIFFELGKIFYGLRLK